MTLADELNARMVDMDGVHQALRYYLAERLDDLPPEDMLEQMYAHADQERVDAARASLIRDPGLLESSALVVLSAAWAEQSERDRIRAVLTETKDKMPVVEVVVLAIVCMYGMYLMATGGITESTETTTRKPDGSFRTDKKIKYHDPARVFTAISGVFRRSAPQVNENPADPKKEISP